MPSPFRNESINQPNYQTKTADYYLNSIDPDLRESFTPEQITAVRTLLESAIPQPSPKLVDLRFTVDLILSRFYVVLFVGKDRRRQRRSYLPDRFAKVGNAIAAVILLIGLNLSVSLFIFLLLYLIKSAIGIDLFQGSHLSDQLQKF